MINFTELIQVDFEYKNIFVTFSLDFIPILVKFYLT
jgi:hypothetical protein